MAFNPNPPRADYQATAGQTNFPFLFKIYFTSDMNVYHTPISTNVTTKLVEGVDYSVVINGDDGGTVILILVVENNDYIVLERELSLTRYVEYQTSGDLLAGTLNADQDYQTYLTSDQNAIKDNSLRLAQGTFGVDTIIPTPIAGYFFRWNTEGTAVEYGAPSTVTVPWGNITGTITDQTDLQTQFGTKLNVEAPTFTGALTGNNASIHAVTANILTIGSFYWQVSPGDLTLYTGGVNEAQVIDEDSSTLHQTSTDLTWGGNTVVTEASTALTNKIEADDYATNLVGGTIKILVSGTDCYITTTGDTPGP